MASTWHNSVCPHDCPSACSLQIEKTAPDRIGKVRGSPDNPYTDGIICAKVSRYAERTHHPDRLLEPLVRVSEKSAPPEFEPIDWEAALDLVASKFNAAAAEFGPESVWPYFYGGTMGQIQQYGINRLSHAMGYSRMKRTFCVQIAFDGWLAGTGKLIGSNPRELAHSDLILIWGCNAAATQINVMHHVSKARKRGARLVVIDPYETPTAKIADLHIAPRPGTDGALACAVMHLLFKHDQVDDAYLKKFTDDPRGLRAHLASRGPEWAEKICDVPAGQIEKLAHWYGNTPKSFIRMGIGFSRTRNGAVNVHAVSCLPALTGAWQHLGGGALLSTSDSFQLDATSIQGLDHSRDRGRWLDMSQIGRVLCGDESALAGGPPVKAMLMQNTNPMLVAPDLGRVREGLLRSDLFVCVHEQFMTETASMADLVLPATTFVEHKDLYSSYGQTFLQNAEIVIDPPAECRSNHHVICEIARRVDARHSGFELSETELIDQALEKSGYPSVSEFEHQHFYDCAPSFEDAHFLAGFNWPDKKFRFSPDWASIGPGGVDMPRFPDYWDVNDQCSDQLPLKLVAAPSRGYLNSSFNNSPSSVRREKKPTLKLHPATAKRHGIESGRSATIGNRQGSITATADTMENMQRDTVVLEGIWPAAAFPEGIGVNVLISSQPAAPNGGAVFHDTAVWIRPA